MNKNLPEWSGDSDLDDAVGDLSNSSKHYDCAEKIYNLRRKRDRTFKQGLFSDPAWDILLDLYISERHKKEIYVTSACLAAGVPASTGLRWITVLIQNGYVERREDQADARRSLLSLTPLGRELLDSLFEQMG